MKRIDKIFNLVTQYTESLTPDSFNSEKIGISSVDIAKQTDFLRNNVSKDLNLLNRERRLIKIIGRPVRYLELTTTEKLLGGKIVSKDLVFNTITSIGKELGPSTTKEDDPFTKLIGWNNSLAQVIQSAKASIVYPPHGLHSLLLGESGVGKSLFAEVMYEFGKAKGIFTTDSPFIRFNCADYAHNPQLLMTQLFGAVKGAYTGAEEEKIGMIEAADHGVLFLDEIHRLPPEGQEMLFHFIDKKIYRKMGDTFHDQEAEVLIIGATTETDNNNLLTTFLRRIPSTLWIPNLEERSPEERLELIKQYAIMEAHKINCDLELSRNAIYQLLTYQPKGNLGQLKSDLQLAVARSYLESKQQAQKVVHVSSKSLPSYIIKFVKPQTLEERNALERMIPSKLEINVKEPITSKTPEIMNHDFVNYYFNKLLISRQRIDLDEVFDEYTNTISKNMILENNYSVLFDDVTKQISVILSELLVKEYHLIFDQSIYLALALFLRNIQEKNSDVSHEMMVSASHYPSNHSIKTAKQMIQIIERRFKIFCSEHELNTLASIIDSLTQKTQQQSTNFMIVAHGTSTGSSMAETINTLLNTSIVIGKDMPLTMAPYEVSAIIQKEIHAHSKEQDWIIFTDMGSLTQIDRQFNLENNRKIYVMETTNLLVILESVRQAIFTFNSSKQIIADIAKMNEDLNYKLQRKIKSYLEIEMNRVIYTVCASGEGVALFLENILSEFLRENHIYDVQLIPLSGNENDLEHIIKSTSKNKEIIAIVGSTCPKNLHFSFISLDEILMKRGFKLLLTLLGVATEKLVELPVSIDRATRKLTVQLCCEALDKYLLYISSDKLQPLLSSFIITLEDTFQRPFSNELLMKIFIHIGCMIERLNFENKQLMCRNEDIQAMYKVHGTKIELIKKSMQTIEESFNFLIPENELFYILQILLDDCYLPE